MNILVLAGGTSTERDVSFVTGSMVYRAIKSRGHNTILLDVFYGIDDEYVSSNIEDTFLLERDWAADIEGISEKDPDLDAVIKNRPESPDGYFGPNVLNLCKACDIVFLALHGENGENGKIQAVFDLFGIKYTGTGYLSSALAMNKGFTKSLFEEKGVPTPKYYVMKSANDDYKPEEYPVVVKTACGGSSVGVYIVKTDSEYAAAVKQAFTYGSDVIVEQYIKGREFSIGVVDGKAYPIIEIAPINGFYDYKNKYQEGSTVETCPANLPAEIAMGMQMAAEEGYKALSMESYGRLDFMMDEEGRYYCLEANTLPGMTPTSLLPQEAAAIGESFEDLCEKIIKVSLDKYK